MGTIKGFLRRFSGREIVKKDFFIIFLMIGCAKAKPEKEPDRTVSVDSLLSATMNIESEGSLDIVSEESQFVTASNEQLKGVIRNVSGPPQFSGLLTGLKTGLVGNFEVRLALTPKYVVAHALVPKDVVSTLSKMDQILVQSVASHEQLVARGLEKINLKNISGRFDLLPIAQVSIMAAGVLQNTTNDIGESTPILEIIPTEFSQASHFIMGHMDTRSRMILASEQLTREVFLEDSVTGRVTDYETLRSQTGIKLRLEDDKEKLFTERKANKLNLFRFVKKSSLTPDELVALNSGRSEIVKQCGESQSLSVGIARSECVMLLSFIVPIQIVAVERSRDSEGFETGLVSLRVLTPSESSRGLIQIQENVEVAEVRPDQILQEVDERKIIRPKQVAGKEFLFRRTLQDSPNSFDYAFAGLAGDLEIVKFEFAEKVVKVIRGEALLSTSGNSSVDKEILMEIPAQYVVMTTLAPDGSQLPFERPVPSTHTNPEAIAIVDWASNKVPNVSSPLNYFGLENCFNSRTQEVSDVDSRVEKSGMLNFTLTSTYASSSVFDCAGIELADYFDRLQTIFSFKERISFKEYKKPEIEDPTLNVPLLAQKKMGFGLFTYSKKRPNVDGEIHLEDTIVNLPSVFDFRDGKSMTYVLAGLPKGEDTQTIQKNAVIISATEKVVADLNKALREATQGTALERSSDFVHLQVEGPSTGGVLGDLDRNYIYYVEKGTESPIIGLGGSHPNPRSGRVEAASVFLYAGNMTKAIARMKRVQAAERARAEIMAPIPLAGEAPQEVAKRRGNGEISTATVAGVDSPLHDMGKVDGKFATAFKLTQAGKRNVQRKGTLLNRFEYVGNKLNRNDIEARMSARSSKLSKAFEAIRTEGLMAKAGFESQARMTQKISSSLGAKGMNKALVSRIRKANYCVYESKPEFMAAGMSGKSTGDSDLELLGKMWVATLAHELGHNFGLRHNFVGSFDKANWSRGEETTRDYSSIMDYLNNDYETYDGFGPQDVAALRAGYGEVLETNDGSLLPINKVPELLGRKGWLDISKSEILSLGVKDYAFCTDEDVGLTPTCQLFDEGTTPLEIVENKIRDYKARYSLLHFPNDRLNFDMGTVGGIVGRNISDFIQMRQFLEESIYQLIQGANIDTVVMPNLIGAMRAMEFFHEIIRTPDASPLMTTEAISSDASSVVDRFAEFEVNTSQGPMLLRGEMKWLLDQRLDDDLSRLAVAGVELDKVISLIMLTERNFGFPRYEAVSLRLAYPDIEKLVIAADSPDQLPTISLLREILDNNVETQIETALGVLGLPKAYKAESTELIRFYAALGAIANLDVNGLEAADNNSTLFRIFSDLGTSPEGVPVMSRLGTQNDLKFFANAENLVSHSVISKGAVLQDVIQKGAPFKALVAQYMASVNPDLAVNAPDPEQNPNRLKQELKKLLKDMPEGANAPTVEEIEEELGGLLETAGVVGQILDSGVGRDFMLDLERFKNEQSSTQIASPVMGLAIEALFDTETLKTPDTLGLIAESRALEPHYGSVFQNVEISSQVFSMLHPEYFR